MKSLTSSLRCDDGTEIPFEWVYEDAPQCEWFRDRAHWPLPAKPMELWLRHHGWPGADRAWHEAGLIPLPMFHRFQMVGPFSYLRTTPYGPERMAQIVPAYYETAARYRSIAAFWERYARPNIQRASAEIAAMSISTPMADIAGLWAFGFHQTFTTSSLLAERSIRLTMLLAESIGNEAALTAHELTQGGDNASQAIDIEIWDLARLARRTPAASSLLGSDASDSDVLAALAREPAAAAFAIAFDASVARHGSRSLGWNIGVPTWSERPEAPLSLIRAQLKSGAASPAELTSQTAARRAAATEEALARTPAGVHDEILGIVKDLEGYVGVREGRAYWQMTITGTVRNVMLRHGQDLVARGRIGTADDVMMLEPADFHGDPSSDLRALVDERRAAWDQYCQLVLPPIIGTPMTPPPPPSTDTELRGAPASRGQVTGTARILHSPEEGARLQRGDILVCVMTTPAWTPLFGIVGGIVTETGGPLSHPAITAREYGIPAVLAVKNATTLLRDGQTVTIDGGAGVVSLSG